MQLKSKHQANHIITASKNYKVIQKIHVTANGTAVHLITE